MSTRTLVSLAASILITGAGLVAMTSSYLAPMQRPSATVDGLPVTTLPAVTVTAKVRPRAPVAAQHTLRRYKAAHGIAAADGRGSPIHDVAAQLDLSHLAMPYYPFDSVSVQISKD
jgi:hypothetical protein